MTDQAHPIAALHDAVSGRLSSAERAALDAHLVVCETCRRELEAMAWVSRQASATADALPIPVDLEASLLRGLDAEDAARRAAAAPAAISRRTWLLVGGGAAAAAVGGVLVNVWWHADADADLPALVATDLRAYAAGRLPLGLRTSDAAALDAHLVAAGLGFDAEVFTFGGMAYDLVGGGTHVLAGRPSALFAYRGVGDLRMICQMYPGVVADLPEPARRLTREGVQFLVYDQDDVTVVFWQDGPVVCVLAANGDPEAVIVLAVAKGVPA